MIAEVVIKKPKMNKSPKYLHFCAKFGRMTQM